MIVQDRPFEDMGAGKNQPRARYDRFQRTGPSLLMTVIVGAGTTALVYFAWYVAGTNPRFEPDNHSGATTVQRFSVVRVWLPQALIDVAMRRPGRPPIHSHEDLRRELDSDQLRDVWYALTVREHHDDGGHNDLTFIRRPYHDPLQFPEFPEVLAVANGNPPGDSGLDFSVVSVSVVPGDFRDRAPRDVLREALESGLE